SRDYPPLSPSPAPPISQECNGSPVAGQVFHPRYLDYSSLRIFVACAECSAACAPHAAELVLLAAALHRCSVSPSGTPLHCTAMHAMHALQATVQRGNDVLLP